jgi:hypothetical protein
MKPVEFTNAYYIKLGRGGEYEESAFREDKIRVGWNGQSLDEINQRNWEVIGKQIQAELLNKGAAKRDLNALMTIVESTNDDIWITFRSPYLHWCKVGAAGIFEDETSKYRKVAGKWRNCDIHDKPLIINQIPGSIAQIQRFPAAICKVSEIEDLRRLINDQQSEEYKAICVARNVLIEQVGNGLKHLHWKDYETLTDLLFRNAGWNRMSLLGEAMQYVDMELEEPITKKLYQVQVKAQASVADFEKYAQRFSPGNYERLYFVVYRPKTDLASYRNTKYENVEIILPERLAQMVVEYGLLEWLLKKIK